MLEFLFGKKKKTSVAAPVSIAPSAVASSVPGVLEPELPELEKVLKFFSRPQLLRDEQVVKADIDDLLAQRSTAVNAKREAIAAVDSEIKEIKRRADKAMVGLLAIEADLKASIIASRDQDVQALMARINQLDLDCKTKLDGLDAKIKLLQIENKVRDIDCRFPRIDMSFLKQVRRPAGKKYDLPKFAMFSIDDPKCTVKVTGYYNRTSRAETTPAAYGPLLDLEGFTTYAVDYCRSQGYNSSTITAEATFKGAVPQPIREVLVEARKIFQSVYLVNEPEWKVKQKAIPLAPPRDPLVVGYRDGVYWLVASFDTTPAEEYIRREFTQGELKDVRG